MDNEEFRSRHLRHKSNWEPSFGTRMRNGSFGYRSTGRVPLIASWSDATNQKQGASGLSKIGCCVDVRFQARG